MSYLMLLITPQRPQHPTNSILIYFDNTTKQIKQKYRIRNMKSSTFCTFKHTCLAVRQAFFLVQVFYGFTFLVIRTNTDQRCLVALINSRNFQNDTMTIGVQIFRAMRFNFDNYKKYYGRYTHICKKIRANEWSKVVSSSFLFCIHDQTTLKH